MRRVARHSALIALTAPEVVARRLAQMAIAGPRPGAGDRREYARMGAEKVAAYCESWNAMTMALWRIQADAWFAMLRAAWTPWTPLRARHSALAAWQRAASRVLVAGMRPVSRRTAANARRLRRAKRRPG